MRQHLNCLTKEVHRKNDSLLLLFTILPFEFALEFLELQPFSQIIIAKDQQSDNLLHEG
jgi:hypothetical protein